jgi:hypothetical protein
MPKTTAAIMNAVNPATPIWFVVLNDDSHYFIRARNRSMAVDVATREWVQHWYDNDLSGEADTLLAASDGNIDMMVDRAIAADRAMPLHLARPLTVEEIAKLPDGTQIIARLG